MRCQRGSMTKEANCPSCGAPVQFRAADSVFLVCPYCSSMVVRQDVNVEAIGTMAELKADLSPLQLGTSGKFEGKSFDLIGRLKIVWTDGNWNEWLAYFEGGKTAWLAEAQGFYALNFPVAATTALPRREDLKVGMTVELGAPNKEQAFTVVDIKETTCGGSEGELPFTAQSGRKTLSVDLADEVGGFAALEYDLDASQGQGTDSEPRAYVGRYVDYDDLSLRNVRRLDGWQ